MKRVLITASDSVDLHKIKDKRIATDFIDS